MPYEMRGFVGRRSEFVARRAGTPGRRPRYRNMLNRAGGPTEGPTKGPAYPPPPSAAPPFRFSAISAGPTSGFQLPPRPAPASSRPTLHVFMSLEYSADAEQAAWATPPCSKVRCFQEPTYLVAQTLKSPCVVAQWKSCPRPCPGLALPSLPAERARREPHVVTLPGRVCGTLCGTLCAWTGTDCIINGFRKFRLGFSPHPFRSMTRADDAFVQQRPIYLL